MVFGAAGKSVITAKGNNVFTITEGVSGIYYGYTNAGYFAPFGSVDPAAFNGQNIESAYFSTTLGSPDIFYLELAGNLAQDFYTSVTPEGLSALTTASADDWAYSSTYDFTRWRWDSVTKPAGWDGSGESTIIFVP